MKTEDTLDVIQRTCPLITLAAWKSVLRVIDLFPEGKVSPYPIPAQDGHNLSLKYKGYEIVIERDGLTTIQFILTTNRKRMDAIQAAIATFHKGLKESA